MNKIIGFCLFYLLISNFLCAQSADKKEDDQIFESSIDWISRKLNYVFYDPIHQNWWTNKFSINEEKRITIKNNSSKNPRSTSPKNKVYNTRTFQIEDINPYTIKVKDVTSSEGRFLEGKIIELRTFSNTKNIHKTINNRRASSTSFMYINIPSQLLDSIPNYANKISEKLKTAILASTRVYSNSEDKQRLIIEILNGSYKSESGKIWKTKKRFESVLKLESEENEIFIGFDGPTFFINMIATDGFSIKKFRLKNSTKLELENIENLEETILFESMNSFRMENEWYYRQ